MRSPLLLKLLLPIWALCLSHQAPAQVLNLLNLNKAADQAKPSGEPLPTISNPDYADRAESHYNLIFTRPARPLDTTNLYQAQRQAIERMSTTNKRLKGQYNKELEDLRTAAIATKKQTDSTIASLRKTILSQDLLQLNRLLATYQKDQPTYKQAVEETAKETARIEGLFDNYWKKPPVVNGVALTFASDSAARALQFTHLPRLTTLSNELRSRYDQFVRLGPPLQSLRDTLLQNSTQLIQYKPRYERLLSKTQTTNDSLQSILRQISMAKQRYQDAQTQWNKRLSSRNEQASATNATALPGIASVAGTRLVVPQLTALGSRRAAIGGGSGVVQLKLFTALGGGAATDAARPQERGAEGLFVREISTFGFSGDAAYAFAPSSGANQGQDKLAVIFSGAYLEKRLTPDSLHTFTTGTLAARIGVEYSPVPKILSLYAHLNTLSFLSNTADVERHYTLARPKDLYGFVTAGLRAQLTLSTKDQTAIEFELGFVLKGDNVRLFVPNNDLAITTIKATLVKSFSLD